jgi:glycolate oxidase FAD binding subunit
MTAMPTLLQPTSAAELCEMIQDAVERSEPLRIVGAGTWLHAGAPTVAACTLSMQALTGIESYVPGDLTITAKAGTSLAELAHATAAHGQWLALDPAGHRDGTLGAAIATASSGPLAHAFGTPRDLVLGLDAVTGYGALVRPGGRVVKNVAGFDLVRLFTGSWGTLGAITSVTVRLRALPVHDVTLALSAADAAARARVVAALRANTLSLLACEWLDAATAQHVGVESASSCVLVRLGGNDDFIRGQLAALRRITDVVECPAAAWGALAQLDNDADVLVMITGSLRDLDARLTRVEQLLDSHAGRHAVHARLRHGAVHIALHEPVEPSVLQALAGQTDDVVSPIVLPLAWWETQPDHFAIGLSGRIRDAFDPARVCNRRVSSHA